MRFHTSEILTTRLCVIALQARRELVRTMTTREPMFNTHLRCLLVTALYSDKTGMASQASLLVLLVHRWDLAVVELVDRLKVGRLMTMVVQVDLPGTECSQHRGHIWLVLVVPAA